MEKSKFTQAEISAGRRLFNAWKRESHSMDFWDHLNKETKKGFRDSVDNSDVPPFKIVKSSTGGIFDDYDNLVKAPYSGPEVPMQVSQDLGDIYAQSAEAMLKGADRLNAGKLQWSLVDFTALEPMVRVLMKGAQKYSPENWKKGLSYTSILDSTMRHMTAFKAGEDLDPETGEPHTAHMLCNLMFLAWHELNRKDLDNRKPDLK